MIKNRSTPKGESFWGHVEAIAAQMDKGTSQSVQSFREMLASGFMTLPELIGIATETLGNQAVRRARFADLGDYEADPYEDMLRQIDASLGQLKQARMAVQKLKTHTHDWNSEDYCSVCGADGRA